MRKLLLATGTMLVISAIAHSQLTSPPEGGNKKAWIGERIGITDVTIHYDRPSVKKRDGEIWGKLVHTGYANLGFGSAQASPWRAGANENTTIEFSTPVKVEGKDLPAGKYGFFVAYDPNQCTIIFSKNSTSWGSYFYDPKEDALRVTVKPVALDKPVEWLKYEFLDQTSNAATIALEWEKLMIPFKVEVDFVNTQLEIFRNELRGEKSFNPGWRSWVQAAQFCLEHNTNLEEGLKWAETGAFTPFMGERNFTTLSTTAQILNKLNRTTEADSLMKVAMPMGSEIEVHTFGRQLLAAKKSKEAFDAFKFNYDKHPNTYTTNMGMTRAYSGLGNYKKALEYANKAYAQATDKPNKDNVERLIKLLKEGKDVN